MHKRLAILPVVVPFIFAACGGEETGSEGPSASPSSGVTSAGTQDTSSPAAMGTTPMPALEPTTPMPAVVPAGEVPAATQPSPTPVIPGPQPTEPSTPIEALDPGPEPSAPSVEPSAPTEPVTEPTEPAMEPMEPVPTEPVDPGPVATPEPMGDPNPSGIMEPGEGGQARPGGQAANLQVLDWAGFGGALTYSFDDAVSSQHGNKEQMFELGVPFTWYLATNAGGDPLNSMYQEALDLGHELGNHTRNHTTNGQDAQDGQTWLMDNYGVTAYTMAAPNGVTAGFVDITNQRFLLDRGVGGGTIGADGNTNWTNLPSNIPNSGAGYDVFKGYADNAAQGRWQTVCIHGFTSGGTGGYQPVSFDGWYEGVVYAKTLDVWIGTMEQVAAYIQGAQAFNEATSTMDGDSQTWTWTLKDTFPPGHYLRVTVDGGTLSQDGTPLPWNEHGFYEVALDAGNLTLSP